jgi:hypothetical protein
MPERPRVTSTNPTPPPARETAAELASEVSERASRVASGSRRQIGSLIDRQRTGAADALDQLIGVVLEAAHRLEEKGQAPLARSALALARRGDAVSRYVRERPVEAIAGDASELARRHPAVFVGSAFAAGLLLARFARSSSHHSRLEA